MRAGSWIKVGRSLGYDHHGIYTGQGRVIHFSGEPMAKFNAVVKSTSLEEFLDGDTLTIVAEPASTARATWVIERAKRSLGDGGYSLVWNNCEHFASRTFTGSSRSSQVANGTAGGSGAVVAGVAGGALVGVPVAASTVTFLGSSTLGSIGLALGILSAPLWPVIAIGAGAAVLGGGAAYAIGRATQSD